MSLKTKRLALLLIGCFVTLAFCLYLALGYFMQFGLDSKVQEALRNFNQEFPGEIKLDRITVSKDGIKAKGLSLADKDKFPTAEIPNIDIKLHPFKYFKDKNIASVLGDVTIDSPRVNLTINPDGTFNILSFKTEEKQKKPFDYLNFISNYTGSIRINKGEILFADKRNGFIYQLNNWDLLVTCRKGEKIQLETNFVPALESLIAKTNNSSVCIKARADILNPSGNCSLSINHLDIKDAASHPFVRRYVSCHKGILDLDLWCTFKAFSWKEVLQSLSYGGRLDINEGQIMAPGLKTPVSQIALTVKISRGMAAIERLKANLAGLGTSLKGKIYLPDAFLDNSPNGNEKNQEQNLEQNPENTSENHSKAAAKKPNILDSLVFDILWNIPNLRAKPLEELLGIKIPCKFNAEVEVKADGTIKNPQIQGIVNLDSLEVKGQELKDGYLKARLAGKLLTIEEFSAKALDGFVHADGYVYLDKEPRIILNMHGNGASLSGISPVGGYIDSFNVSLLGTAKEPVVYGSTPRVSGFYGAAKDLNWAQGSFIYTGSNVTLTDGYVSTSLGNASLPFAFYDLNDSFLYGTVKTPGIQLPTFKIGALGQLNTKVAGQLSVYGTPTNLNDLVVYGVSENSDLSLGSLKVTGLSGPIGLQNMQLYFPEMLGSAAGGNVAATGWVGLAGGSSDLSLRGENVDVSSFIHLLNYNIPAVIAGQGNVGLNWSSKGRNELNWLNVYVNSQGIQQYKPFNMALKGYFGRNKLGSVAWVDKVPLKPVKATSDLTVAGVFTGALGAWGTNDDVHFAYNLGMEDSPVENIAGDHLLALGQGSYKDKTVFLDRNLLAWNYETLEQEGVSYPRLSAKVVPWFGPVLANSLTNQGTISSPLPNNGMAVVNGWVKPGKPMAYNLDVEAKGVNLAWLCGQDWLPEVKSLTETANVKAGLVNAFAKVSNQHGMMHLMPGSFIEAPWIMAQSGNNSQYYSMASNLHMAENKPGKMGSIVFDHLLVSNEPFDYRIPLGSLNKDDSWTKTGNDGWLTAKGTVDGTLVDIELSGRSWSMLNTQAIVPQSLNLSSSSFFGHWSTDKLSVQVDTKNAVSTLQLNGKFTLNDGYLALSGQLVPIEQITADIVRSHDKSLNLENFTLDSGNLHLKGRGKRNKEGAWQAEVWSEDFPLDYLSHWNPQLAKLDGLGRMALNFNSPDSSLDEVNFNFGFEGSRVAWRSHPTELLFPSFRLGTVNQQDGAYTVDKDSSIAITRRGDEINLYIPQRAAEVTVFRNIPAPDPFLTSLSFSGGVSFVPNFEGGLKAWFMGPDGPSFGYESHPFRIDVNDFNNNIARILLGIPPTDRRFTFSSVTNLKGQWYRDHLISSLPGSLEYTSNISHFNLGTASKGGEKWVGLSIADPINMYYRREEDFGRFVVEPFALKPHQYHGEGPEVYSVNETEDKADNSNKGNENKNNPHEMISHTGSITGEANIVLMRDTNKILSRSNPNTRLTLSEEKKNKLKLRVTNLPTSELSYFLPDNSSFGNINNIVLDATGPLLSPNLSMLFDVVNGDLGPLHFAAIEGGLFAEHTDRQGNYRIRLGSSQSNPQKPQSLSQPVAKAKQSANTDSQNTALSVLANDGVKIFFGDEKNTDKTLELFGFLPYKFSRVRPDKSDSLQPVWSGISVDQGGELDFLARLNDKGLGLLQDVVPDIEQSSGFMKGEMHLTGTTDRPELAGRLEVEDGSITHGKLGTISDLDVATNFLQLDPSQVDNFEVAVPKGVKVSRLAIEKFAGILGDAPFTLKGQADMAGFEPMAVNLSFDGDRLPLQWGDLFKGIVDVHLNMDAVPETAQDGTIKLSPVVAGDIYVEKGDVTLALDSLTSSKSPKDSAEENAKNGIVSPPLPVDYKVRLAMADDVYMHFLNSRVRTSGELWIVPDTKTNTPVLLGAVNLSRGVITLPFYESEFVLRGGQVEFDRSVMPTLRNVQADTEVSNYSVTAYVNGTYPDIDVEFVSNPPLSQREIQRLLALGMFSSSYTPQSQSASYGTQGATGSDYVSTNLKMGTSGVAMLGKMIASPLTSEIGRVLMLSDFSFDFSPPYDYSIKLGKALDKDDKVLFTLTRIMKTNSGKDESIYGIEWRFKANWMTRIAFDQDGAFRPWIQGLWEFW